MIHRTLLSILQKEGTAMNYLVLVGRILYALIFVMAGPGHFTANTIAFAASKGVPLASIAVPLSGIIAMAGGLSIAAGYKAKWGGWLIVLFLVPVTVMIHNFWAMTDPNMAQVNQIMFMKNASMLGAALLITHFGPGPLSVDNRK
jgi:putative oxidoreductase